MSSPSSSSNDPNQEAPAGASRGNLALVVVTLALMAGLVWAMSPRRSSFVPAPLRPLPPGCPAANAIFTPSNITELPMLPLDKLGKEQKYRLLLRLNMEPCPCGCNVSIAACLATHPRCESAKQLADRMLAEAQTSGQ
ncbi:MAG TPA: hypothetical protein VFD30_14955 [Terriglobia bacterium]|nr:hypothetical protein [Terriglobia bacterium]